MKVIPISPRGYCKGVVNAINIAKKQAHKENVQILGMIVHNQYVVDALEKLGIKTIENNQKTRLEMLERINNGTVVFTAHGVGDDVKEKAKAKNLNIIDATCPDVTKSHDLIRNYLKDGYEILYIGKHGHPESEGARAIDYQKVHLITEKADIKKVKLGPKYVITNQTTMSLYDIFDICEYAKKIIPDLIIAEETCNATKVRQEAIKNMAQEIDVVFIVGDPHSNNTQKLAAIAKKLPNKTVYLIETVKDIKPEMLKNKTVAGVSAGASTPTYLTNLVISYLKQFIYGDERTYPYPQIELDKII